MSDSIADRVYPERRFGGFTRFDGTVAFCSRVQALLGENVVVLDVGCGRGKRADDDAPYRQGLQDFRGPSRRVIGIDVDPEAETNPFVHEFRRIEDTAHWPVDDTSVNLAYSDYVLEHVEDPESFFREAWRVLRPGGYLCMRTPNAWGYVAVVSRLVPNRYHARATGVAQSGRKAEDVFPTVYRCNTGRSMRGMLQRAGFEHCVYTIESEPHYMSFSNLAYRAAAVVHRAMPPWFQSTLLGFARKPPTAR